MLSRLPPPCQAGSSQNLRLNQQHRSDFIDTFTKLAYRLHLHSNHYTAIETKW